MLTQASKAKQHGTNCIGIGPSCVVLQQLCVCVCVCFQRFLRVYAILPGNINDAGIGIATNDLLVVPVLFL